jgi:hypothetical protein
MARSPAWLLEHARNVYSQDGEDGVIEKILDVLPDGNKWCVEFGAWDGISLSNTRNLIEHKGYSAVLIEGSEKRIQDLRRNYAHNANVTGVNAFVGFRKDDNLDHILRKTRAPRDFDLLSVDIDGNDYHVWKAVEDYQPKVVCIEFNPTIPPAIDFVQPADPGVNQGSSLQALARLGREKGYELVAASHSNAFFVLSRFFPLFEIEANDPNSLWLDQRSITYLFSGYDGHVFLRGNGKLPWHKLGLSERRAQTLPRFLQRYPGNYSKFHLLGFAAYLFLSDPRRFFKEISRRLWHGDSTFE